MSEVAFEPWPKIARLNRDIIVTEKIDGTNAAVLVTRDGDIDDPNVLATIRIDGDELYIYTQSRTRFVTREADNYGFAKWVQENAQALGHTLGEGRHFGEWWGSGIQKGYGAPKGLRYFSLFNTSRWGWDYGQGPIDNTEIPGLGVVPTLYQGPFDQSHINDCLTALELFGSIASPGYMNPEGVVVFHTAANEMFKVTLHGDEAPKGPLAHARDEEPAK